MPVGNNQTLNLTDVDDGLVQRELSRLKSLKGLKIAHLNCLSLTKHIDEIRCMVIDTNIDIMTLSETHLCENIDDGEICIPGYTLLRRDRNRSGGGVAMYIKDNLTFIRKYELSEDTNLEMIVIEMKFEKQKPFYVICWYRPPNSKLEVFNAFERVIQKVDDMKVPFFVLGDINCDVTNNLLWNTRKLIEIMESYNCAQVIDKHTRVTKTSSTIVDLIFCNDEQKLSESGVIEVSVSDHYMIYCVIGKHQCHNNDNTHKYKTGRNLKNFDVEAFRKDMNDIDFNPVYEINNPEEACSVFLSLIMKVVDKHAPLRKTRIKQKDSPWMTPIILQLIRSRDRLKRKAKRSKETDDWDNYKQARNNVTSEIRRAKRQFISTKIESAVRDVKKIWKTLRYLTPEKKTGSQATSIKVNDHYVCGQELSDSFNDYFSTIGKTLHDTFVNNGNNANPMTIIPNVNPFVFNDAPIAEIEDILQTLSENKATGPDNLPAKLLKSAASIIATPIAHILNQSLRTGIIPSQWKCARVTPIYKGGEKTNMENYRPISVIPILAKIMERVVYTQLFKYLTENNILSDCQSGFRPLHSTQTALLNVTDTWLNAIDRGNIVGLVMIDLKKAFDTVDHTILIEKLKMYNFGQCTLKWFTNYFEERKQFTSVNGFTSEERDITCGVPQGSLLGPLLFSIFVNDMPGNVHSCDVALYADDTCIFTSSKDPIEVSRKLNEDLLRVSCWLKENKLMVNPRKCEVMFIGTQQRLKRLQDIIVDCHIYIDHNEIKRVESCKYLGVIIDQNMLWKNQVDHVKKKVIKCLYLLKRLRPYINQYIALTFYKSIIQCHFDYCSVVWANALKTDLNQLQILQNRSLRIVMNVDYMYATNNLYDTLKLDRLHLRWSKQLACTIYRSIHKMCPPYLSNIFVFRDSVYFTRSGPNTLRLTQPKTNYGKRSLTYRGAKIWNELNYPKPTIVSIETFKRHINSNPIILSILSRQT